MGKKHSTNSSWFCELCQVPCPSEYQKKQHLEGKKHRQKLEEVEKRRALAQPASSIGTSAGSAPAPPPPLEAGGRPISTPCRATQPFQVAATALPALPGLTPGTLDAAPAAATAATATAPPPPQQEVLAAGIFILNKIDNDYAAHLQQPHSQKRKRQSSAASPPPPLKKLPEELRDALKRKRDVNLFVQGGEVCLQFHYNELIMGGVKAHMPGRRWDPKARMWKCPLESLPEAILLYEHMGRKADEELKQRAAHVRERCPDGCSSANIRLETSLFCPRSVTTSAKELGAVKVTFNYDSEIVEKMKLLHPSVRTYDKSDRSWRVDLLSMPDLLFLLRSLKYQGSSELEDLTALLLKLGRLISAPVLPNDVEGIPGISAQSSTSSPSEVEDTLRDIVVTVDSHEEGKIDRSNIGCAKKPRLAAHPGRHADLSAAILRIQGSLRRHQRPRHSGSQDQPCDCGRPWALVGERHCCRYYGHFLCKECGNAWTSGYTWKGVPQACRECEAESLPVKVEQLQDRPVCSAGGGAHDSSRCCMCRALGFNCSLMC
mmetsp:Transcript_18037/g.42148  ORF Transcript_18037/g.42148 Transcript_18037/m.42148 type:complete len:546 (+) Transcript_18037:37-1674(+)